MKENDRSMSHASELLKALNKRLEKIEKTQYIILSYLIPSAEPTDEEKRIIEEGLKDSEIVDEKELLRILRK